MRTLRSTVQELTEDLATKPRRYPVVRSGERDVIPWLVRLSVYRRDGLHCRTCVYSAPDSGQGLELDHMLPWSAGGPDDSSNLRCLCVACNQKRSNWDDGADEGFALRPTTWWCWECWRIPGADKPMDDDEREQPDTSKPVWRDGTNLNAVRRVESPETQVYCASCFGYGYSDLVLDGPQRVAIVAACVPERSEPTAALA